jgi:hypothetical protein
VACLALVVAGFVMVVRHFDAPPPRWGNLGPRLQQAPPGTQTIQTFLDAVNESNLALVSFFEKGDGGQLAGALAKLEQSPGVDAPAELLRDDLKTLVARGRDLAADPNLPQRERMGRAQQLAADHAAWQERFQRWAETEGREYGITLREATEEEKQ